MHWNILPRFALEKVGLHVSVNSFAHRAFAFEASVKTPCLLWVCRAFTLRSEIHNIPEISGKLHQLPENILITSLTLRMQTCAFFPLSPVMEFLEGALLDFYLFIFYNKAFFYLPFLSTLTKWKCTDMLEHHHLNV